MVKPGVSKLPMQDKHGSCYTEELGDTICQLLASGRTLKSICEGDGMPHSSTVMSWVFKDEAFREKYNLARKMQVEGWADEVVEIADDGTNDYMEAQRRRGKVVLCDHENVNRSKLRIDARLRLMAKFNPEKYGDKIDVTHGGSVSAQLIIKGREKSDSSGSAGTGSGGPG